MRGHVEQQRSMTAIVQPIVTTVMLCLSCLSCDHRGQRQGDESQRVAPNTQTGATKTSSPSDQNDEPADLSPGSDASTTLDDDDLLDDAVTDQLRGGTREGEDLATLRAEPDAVDFQRTMFPGKTSGVGDAIRRQVSSSFGRFLECATVHLDDPNDLPRVVVEFTIGADGGVVDAVAEGPQPYAGCLLSAMEQIQFSLPTDRPVRVRYPVYP